MSTLRITVSIVNWNTREELRECLQALRLLPEGTARIAVVDNASSDGSAAMVAAEFPEVRLHALAENLGFAGGNNVALRGVDTEFALILNPDVRVTPDSVARLLAFLDHTPEATAVSPLLAGEDGVPQTHLYRRFPTLPQVLLFWTVLGPVARQSGSLRRRWFEHDLRSTEPVEVEQLPGAAILLRTEALRETGGWDPDYFIWFEDVDWCYRVRQAGGRLYVLPAARVAHHGGASFRLWGLETRVLQFYRAYARFACKHRLERLVRWSMPVLGADLAVKDVALRAAGFLRLPGVPRGASLAPARRAMKEVVRLHRAGKPVRFTDSGT
jgi:GT2 family glycosyltransferase